MSKLVRNYVNKLFSMQDVWYECFGEVLPYSKCFCPFHDNTDSPAAKVYENHLTCFGSCQRSYYPYDFLKRFRPDLLKVYTFHVLPEPTVDLTPRVLCRFGRGLSVDVLMKKVLDL